MDFDNLPDGVLIANADGIVERANTAVLRMAGVGPERLLGRHIRVVMPLDDLNGHTWVDCVRPYDGIATRTRISEQAWFSPWGNEVLVTAALVRDKPGGKVKQLIVSMRSSKERNRLDRERSELVATVAHELRSPLTGVKGFTATLLSNWDRFTDDQRKLILETIDADADRLTRLITELLDVARIDSGRLTLRSEPVDVAKVVESVLHNVSAGSGQVQGLQIVDAPRTVWADSDRLTQVVTNLVENANRHGQGLRAISVGNIEGGVFVRIEDNGPGIPFDNRKRIFNRFWRSGPGAGSGLGMYIVKGVVDLHDGTIDIDDGDPVGAVITITLPVTTSRKASMSAPNNDYDPVEVTPLRAEEVVRMRDDAITAIAAADSLETLRPVSYTHLRAHE